MTALGFYSMFGSLEPISELELKHEMVTSISVEAFPSASRKRLEDGWKRSKWK